MKAQDVANTLWAYAKAGWTLDSDVGRALAMRAQALASTMNEQAVANTIWACAKLELMASAAPRKPFFTALIMFIQRMINSFHM